jgi:EF hand
MRNHVLVLMTTAAIVACGGIAAKAQAPSVQTPSAQQSPTAQQIPGMHRQDQSSEDEDSDPPGCQGFHGGMMGHGGMIGMMSHGMMGRGLMMRIIFSLMDADSDGTLSLQEFQAAHERIFKAMDTDHDGTVTLEEMQDFMRGVKSPASHQ